MPRSSLGGADLQCASPDFVPLIFIEALGAADSLSFDHLFLVGVFVPSGCCGFKYWHLFCTLTHINPSLCT